MTTLTIGDATVGYATEGEGAPLLLLHGTTMDRTAWDMVRAGLPAEYEFVAVDFPGSGESSMPTAPLEVDDLVQQSLAVMSHLGHERFHVAGYSLGAVIALALAGTAPERVRSVTSLCGWATTDARMRFTFGLWRELIRTDPALFMRYAVADGFTAATIAALEPMLEGIVAAGGAALAPGSDAHLDLDHRVDIDGLITSITAPTLLIAGAEDRWVDASHSQAIAPRIPGAQLVILPAGHLVIQEGAAAVAELLHGHASVA
ncbi:MAG: alpha/beta fold hydrolase [Ilumatobacteraceae bacterium]